MQLTARQERILKTVVECYIATAHPVGSAAIVAASLLAVSSATVRHEVAVLEELGYLRQLHTSGGRVPTNTGYRYYVEHLMPSNSLPRAEAHIILHQFHQAHMEMQEWLKLAAAVMASRMHNVGLITAPKPSEVRLRHVEAISIQTMTALIIVVLQDGTVLQEMMTLAEPRTQEELSAQADRLTETLRGMTANEVGARIGSLAVPDEDMARMVEHLLQRAEEQHAQVYHAGLADMIRQPEFAGPRPGEAMGLTTERLRYMVEFLQQDIGVHQFLANLATGADVRIIIGGEETSRGLQDYSFVLGRYGSERASFGFLGIAGPTRMEYPRAVALVRYMAGLMTDLMQAG